MDTAVRSIPDIQDRDGPWAREAGRHGRRNLPRRWLDEWLALQRTRLHDLRHTHATLLLQAGVPIKVVSERLGHTTIAMTMDIYAHVLPAMTATPRPRSAPSSRRQHPLRAAAWLMRRL